ncbi:unnamed protein product [Cylindrotheca closterium]|uniref:DUF6824 domain-containing protein n=1 Tax=Cylindrotheca closterium TaxID=2856 RepID=A0AAD2FRZ3_9STRA|nr:unnamed protein product [Cylindrotheca closterium]
MTKESNVSQSPSAIEFKYSSIPIEDSQLAPTMPAENPLQSSPVLPPCEARDNATPTQVKQEKLSSSETNGDARSDTSISNHTMVPVSGSPRDIICGRGLHIMNHHGNHNLHLIVDRYRQAYLTSTRKDKADITRRIVQHLKSTGARFLRRFNDDGDDKWVEVDERTAYKKVGHALRLRKSDLGQSFLKSIVHSLPRRETSSSQHMAVMPIGPQSTMSHPPRLPFSSSLTMQLPLPSSRNQFQVMATRSALPPAVGGQAPPTLHPSVVHGYGNVAMDPRLFSQVFATTLSVMTQFKHQELLPLHASSADSRMFNESPKEGGKRNGN